MSTFKIIGLLFKDTYRSSKSGSKGGKIGLIVAFSVIYLLFELGIVTTLIELAPYFMEEGLISELLTAVMGFGVMAVATLGIMPMLSLLYFSKDSEFFLGLPISPTKVYFAKLASVYITQLGFTAAILLPALYSIGITVGLNWAFYIIIFLGVILLPVFSLLVVSVLCLPLMYLIRFFKNRGAVASIVALLFFIAVFFLYMLMVRSSTDMPEDAELAAFMVGPITRAAKIFIPFLALGRMATFTAVFGYGQGVSFILNFLIFIAPAIILAAIAMLISRTAYNRAVATQLENVKRTASGEIYQDKRSINRALIGKEWKEIVRTPIFCLQCFIGLIIMPIAIVAAGVSGEFSYYLTASAEEQCLMWIVVAATIQLIAVSMNIGASTSISRDGGSFYISKLLPVPYETQIKAKILFYNMIYAADITLCFGILYVFLGFKLWWMGLVLYLYTLIINYGYISLCILLDLSKPKLDWKSHREIVKNSRNAVLPTLLGMGASIVICGLAFGLFALLINSRISANFAAIIVLVLMLGIALAFTLVVRKILRKNAKKYFERIEA